MSEISTVDDQPLLSEDDTVLPSQDDEPLLPSQDDVTATPYVEARLSTIFSLFLGLIFRHHGASLTVRQNVAQQLKDLLANLIYLLPFVVIGQIWNFALVIVSTVMMILTVHEKSDDLVRAWICGYSFVCLTRMILEWMEYKRRNQRFERRRITIAESRTLTMSRFLDDIDTYDRPARKCGWIQSTITYVWWVAGIMLMVYDNKNRLHVAPRLFWLNVVYLAIDAFFAAVYILMWCSCVFAVSFCLPYVIVFMYCINDQDGASDKVINQIPKYKYEISTDEQQPEAILVPVATTGQLHSVEPQPKHLNKDADCCICMHSYKVGSELHLLPCKHHFHVECILKWLMVSRNCPLCHKNVKIVEDVAV